MLLHVPSILKLNTHRRSVIISQKISVIISAEFFIIVIYGDWTSYMLPFDSSSNGPYEITEGLLRDS